MGIGCVYPVLEVVHVHAFCYTPLPLIPPPRFPYFVCIPLSRMLNLAGDFVQSVAQENVRVLAVAHTDCELRRTDLRSQPVSVLGTEWSCMHSKILIVRTCAAKSALFVHVQPNPHCSYTCSKSSLLYMCSKSSLFVHVQQILILRTCTANPHSSYMYSKSSFFVHVQQILIVCTCTANPLFFVHVRQIL